MEHGDWLKQLAECKSHMAVTKLAARAYRDGAVNARLAAAIEQRHALITVRVVRVSRVHTLREVRNAVANAERGSHDPYLWGYGTMLVRKYLTWKLAEARRAAGLEPPR